MIVSLDELACGDFVDFGKNEDRFGRLFRSHDEKEDTEFLEIQLKVFKKDDQQEVRNRWQFNLEESVSKQLLQLWNQSVLVASGFVREKNGDYCDVTPIERVERTNQACSKGHHKCG